MPSPGHRPSSGRGGRSWPPCHGCSSMGAETAKSVSCDLPLLVWSHAIAMDDVAWLDPYRHGFVAGACAGPRVARGGRERAASRDIVTWACLVVIACTAMTSRPGMAWAQPGTEDILAIPVHPDVPTILHLPDTITRARVNPGSSMEVTLVGRTLHVRPDSGVPAGLEALLAVETATMLLTFRLHVVEHSEDAREELVVVAMQSEQRAEVGTIEDSTEPAGSSRFALSLHVTTALAGVTAIHVPEYAPDKGRQTHHSLGLRVGVIPHGGRWSMEAGVSTEWAAPTIHVKKLEGDMVQLEREVSGPWLQADLCMRVRAGTRWMPTAQMGAGLQMQLRNVKDTEVAAMVRKPLDSVEDMPLGVIMLLGMGLQRQVGDMLLGIDLQLRQGVPAEYRSVGAFLFMAFVLDQGD
jgi:hypothetical protein